MQVRSADAGELYADNRFAGSQRIRYREIFELQRFAERIENGSAGAGAQTEPLPSDFA